MDIETVDDDPIRQYTADEKSLLTKHLLQITEQIRKIDSKEEYSVHLICLWHEQLFSGVRDHAGRYRTNEYGEEYLAFGPYRENRSAFRGDVEKELIRHEQEAKNLFSQLTSLEITVSSIDFVREIIKVALYLHVDLVKIHPFRDGNGRVGRLIITYVLCRWSLPPLAIEVPRLEYIDCLNHYYRFRDFDPLLKLALRIYANQLE